MAVISIDHPKPICFTDLLVQLLKPELNLMGILQDPIQCIITNLKACSLYFTVNDATDKLKVGLTRKKLTN